MLQDISYKDYRRSDDIHGTVLYPAVMVAPVQEDILRDLYHQDTIHSILDPFHGSGTALYESHKIFPHARIYGCDINPLANLITKTKLTGVSDYIQEEIENLRQRLENDNSTDIFEFENRKKWFRNDIAQSLSKIRRAILRTERRNDRLFFWCMMCDVVRRYSNSRGSTYKLHIKPQEKIDAMVDNTIEDFLHAVEENYHWFETMHCDNFVLSKQNLMDYLPCFRNNKIDLLITSPPYGDNHTTVPYGLFSSLALKWIYQEDLELEGWELNNYSVIDSHSLGSGRISTALNSVQLQLLAPFLDQISDDKKVKVQRFFHAYFDCLDLFAEIVEKYIVLTLGNRTVDRVKIDLAYISGQYLKSKGFHEYQTVSREILYKRTPSLTSIVQDEPVESMSKEYVLIYKK